MQEFEQELHRQASTTEYKRCKKKLSDTEDTIGENYT